jgi:hypothetical protein
VVLSYFLFPVLRAPRAQNGKQRCCSTLLPQAKICFKAGHGVNRVNNRRSAEQFVANMAFPLAEAISVYGGMTFLLHFGL